MTILELSEYVPYLLNRAGSRLADIFSRALQKDGLTVHMWRALIAIHSNNGMRAGELAVATSLEPSAVSRILGALVKMGFVRRVHDEEDARAVAVHMTDTGREVVGRLIPHALHYEKAALAGFSSEDVAQFKALLLRLYENLESLEDSLLATPQEKPAET